MCFYSGPSIKNRRFISACNSSVGFAVSDGMIVAVMSVSLFHHCHWITLLGGLVDCTLLYAIIHMTFVLYLFFICNQIFYIYLYNLFN